MSTQLAAQIWNLVNDVIPYEDREQFADGLVNILLDHGFDLSEIKEEFIDDRDVKAALKYYTEEADEEEELEEYCDEDADDNDW
jgi:hypothetical protein